MKCAAQLFIFFMLISMFSCEEKSATVFITADIKGEQVSQIQFLNPILDISENLIVDGPEPLRIDLGGKPSIVKVKAGRASQYIYTEPGNNINITRPENKREFTITTDYQTEQDLLNEFEKTIGAAMGKFGPYQIMTVGVDSFLQLVDEKYKKSSELLRLAGNNGKAKKEVISWLESRIEAGKLLDKVNYPGYHYYYVKKVADLGEDYFSFIKDFDFDNETAYYFDDVVYAAETAIAHDINHEEMESSEKYYQKKYESIPKYVSKQNLIEYLEYKILMDKMKNDGGPQGLETQLTDFIDRVKSKERLNRISNETSRWSHLKKGSLAPNFTAFERDGKEVKLEDLRGKNVYIDVWATWCGPCIREIPSLKLMEEKYHGENVEFVSVSIDNEKDKQKWKDFVVERELGGTQIMAENAWRSGIATNYNINSIPRFMMVDKQGKLVSVNAPRPSMEKQFNSMLADVLE